MIFVSSVEAQVYRFETQEEAKKNFLKEMFFEVRGERLILQPGKSGSN